jgi:hypothetical protein
VICRGNPDCIALRYDPDCEYVDGELFERNWGESDHSALQGIIFAFRLRLHGIVSPTSASRHKRSGAESCASRMELKIDDYLAFCVKYIWLIDPRRRKAWSYTNEKKRESAEVLTTSEPRLTERSTTISRLKRR